MLTRKRPADSSTLMLSTLKRVARPAEETSWEMVNSTASFLQVRE